MGGGSVDKTQHDAGKMSGRSIDKTQRDAGDGLSRKHGNMGAWMHGRSPFRQGVIYTHFS